MGRRLQILTDTNNSCLFQIQQAQRVCRQNLVLLIPFLSVAFRFLNVVHISYRYGQITLPVVPYLCAFSPLRSRTLSRYPGCFTAVVGICSFAVGVDFASDKLKHAKTCFPSQHAVPVILHDQEHAGVYSDRSLRNQARGNMQDNANCTTQWQNALGLTR